jgi:hypothetical protein
MSGGLRRHMWRTQAAAAAAAGRGLTSREHVTFMRQMESRQQQLTQRLAAVDSELVLLEQLASGGERGVESDQGCGGLTASELSRIACYKAGSSDIGEVCSICLSEVHAGETLAKLACCHGFHEGCVAEWLSRAVTCPLCKSHALGNSPQPITCAPSGNERTNLTTATPVHAHVSSAAVLTATSTLALPPAPSPLRAAPRPRAKRLPRSWPRRATDEQILSLPSITRPLTANDSLGIHDRHPGTTSTQDAALRTSRTASTVAPPRAPPAHRRQRRVSLTLPPQTITAPQPALPIPPRGPTAPRPPHAPTTKTEASDAGRPRLGGFIPMAMHAFDFD